MNPSIEKALVRFFQSDYYLGGRFIAISPMDLYQQLIIHGLIPSIPQDVVHQFVVNRNLELVSYCDVPEDPRYCFDRVQVLSILIPNASK